MAVSAGLFLADLLGGERRKTGWSRAEAAGDFGPWRQQPILRRAQWDAGALRDIVRDSALERLSVLLGEGVLDGVEVGAVGRQQTQAGAGRLDQGLDLRPLVCRQVVHDDDVVGSQFGDEHVLDVGLEARSIDGAVQHEGRHDPAQAQAGHQRRLPVAVRHAHPQPLAAWGAPVRAGHLGGGAGLVDEDQALGIEIELAVEPCLPRLADVGAVLLGSVRGLFSRVTAWRRK